MKSKRWLTIWTALVLISLLIIGILVYWVDPFFHYHKPDTTRFFYALDNERSQNDGIMKHFDYNAIMTGTSMIQNCKTSEIDEIFKVKSIKVPYSGATYKEINDGLRTALQTNPDLKIIMRCLDYGMLLNDENGMRLDMGQYPNYLYDKNPFNDVYYLFNKDVLFGRVCPMMTSADSGITSFDNYSRWQEEYTFGINAVIPEGVLSGSPASPAHLTEREKYTVYANVTKNVISLATEYPDVQFYYFFSPYSAVWWNNIVKDGSVFSYIEAEQYAIELILQQDNIHLYSFNNRTDITTDLNNYKDSVHYGEWINSLMLKWIYNGEYMITEDNYKEYINKELSFYTSFDYDSLNQQIDYECDYYAAALLNKELKETEPIYVSDLDDDSWELSNAVVIDNGYNSKKGILCRENETREENNDTNFQEYISNTEYIGAQVKVDNIGDHKYLVFYGKKIGEFGQPIVYVYNQKNEICGSYIGNNQNLDNGWHQYLISITDIEGTITIVFNGEAADLSIDGDTGFVYSDITIY